MQSPGQSYYAFLVLWVSFLLRNSSATYNVTFFYFYFDPVAPNEIPNPESCGLCPALEVAQKHIRKQYPLISENLNIVGIPYGQNLSCMDAVGPTTAYLYEEYFRNPDEYPTNFTDSFVACSINVCSAEMVAAMATFSAATNTILMVDGLDASISNKTTYPTTINLNVSPDSSYFRALHAMALRFGWSSGAYICAPPVTNGQDIPFPEVLCGQVQHVLREFGSNRFNLNRFLPTAGEGTQSGVSFTHPLKDPLLRSSRDAAWFACSGLPLGPSVRSTVVDYVVPNFVLLELVGHLEASLQGMTNGDYVFLTPQHVTFDWIPTCKLDCPINLEAESHHLLQSLLVISEIGVDFERPNIKSLLAAADEISVAKYNLTKRPNETDSVQSIRIIDSFFMTAQVLNRTWDELRTLDAQSFIRRLLNHTYHLLAGGVFIDDHGSLILPVPVLRFNATSRAWQSSFWCHPMTFDIEYKSKQDERWFGHERIPGDFPPPKHDVFPEIQYAPAVAVTLAVLLLSCLAFNARRYYVMYRYRHLYIDAWHTAKFISPPDTEKSIQPTVSIDMKVVFGETQATAKMFYSVSQSPSAFLHNVSRNTKFWLTMLSVHDAKHANLTILYGMTLRRALGECYFLSEYCERGSLNRLIHSNELLTDVQFRLAFIRDLTEGLNFLHKSAVSYHGDLTIQNCLVDSHFTVKISQAGFSQITYALAKTTTSPSVHYQQAEDVRNYGLILRDLLTDATVDDTSE
ncbi:hypothetical protein BV898_10185 [Hypsibius exemplaris]|uniref:guanylate cyclase n=1 Tax=Hypsibius exemplaris TaxID=2072580 RepID=A0A1W0WKD9_HYPEX|nr:hypothetical protein BV898_10185 [Hypsibius exemplaris]